jgi:hypothetical protein
MSQLEVDKIIPQSGTTLTIGDSGDTITISSGAGFQSNGIYDNSSSTSLFINGSNRVTVGTDSGYGLDNSADDFVVANILSNSGMSIVSNASNSSSIFFTDTGVSSIGKIVYSHSSDDMKFTTANSEAMRIDSSGRLLVGKTSDNNNSTGCQVEGDGTLSASRNGFAPLILNRQTSDGIIAEFRKDGTAVGTIATNAGDLLTGTGDTGFRFYDAGDAIIPNNISSPGNRDNAIDLGISSVRYKDLYLAGGLYVGGTGTANKLDDYEEGTWTPTASQGSVSHVASGYIKIGRLVTLTIDLLNFTNTTSTDFIQINGIPFAVDSSENMATGAMFGERIDTNNNGNSVQAVLTGTSTGILFFNGVGSTNFAQLKYTDINDGTDCAIRGTITYLAAS